MVTLNWMLFTGMTLMVLTGLITRSAIIMIVAAVFAIVLVINAQENLERLVWAASGVIFAYIAVNFAGRTRRSQDEYD